MLNIRYEEELLVVAALDDKLEQMIDHFNTTCKKHPNIADPDYWAPKIGKLAGIIYRSHLESWEFAGGSPKEIYINRARMKESNDPEIQ